MNISADNNKFVYAIKELKNSFIKNYSYKRF